MFSLFKGEYENDLGGDGVSGMNARQWVRGCQLFGEAMAWKLGDSGDGGCLCPASPSSHGRLSSGTAPPSGTGSQRSQLASCQATRDEPSRSFLRQF